MPFEKGHKIGRPKGAKNKLPKKTKDLIKKIDHVTTDLDLLSDFMPESMVSKASDLLMLDYASEKLGQDWNKLKPEQRVKYFIMLLKYFKPNLDKQKGDQINVIQISTPASQPDKDTDTSPIIIMDPEDGPTE